MKILGKEDFSCVGMVAKHCDFSKLCIAEDEAIIFDIGGLLCDFWDDVLKVFRNGDFNNDFNEDFDVNKFNYSHLFPSDMDVIEQSQLFNVLWYGGEYEYCNGRTRSFLGLKRTLVYYTYARYILLNGFNDTPSGMVQKTNEWSIPKPLNEVQTFSDKYRNMGFVSYENTLGFLCANKDKFITFNSGECSNECGCGDAECGRKTNVKGYGIKSAIIKK